MLDCEGDGWHLAHYAVVMGIQKLDSDGTVTNASWIASPVDQADYITEGLISAVMDNMHTTDDDD